MRSGQNDQFHRQWRFNSGAECTTYKENEMSSILTNNGAMVALQTLKSINSNMLQTQSEISTGKSISSARDNSALWAISKVMESDVKGFDAIAGSLALGESTVAVARNAAETVTDLLTDIKVKVVAAQESNVDRGKIQEDITALRGQIESVVGAAQFNGLNLVDGSSTDALEVLSSLDRGADGTVSARTIDVERSSLSLNGVASTVVFGGNAATGIATMGAATIAAGASNTFTIDQAYDGASYQIELGAIDLSVSGGGTSTGTRDFQFVASGSDSTESVAANLQNQLSAYFNANTDAGDYTATVSGNEITIAVGAGVSAPLETTATLEDGGTAGFTNTDGLADLATIDVSTDIGASNALAAIDSLIETSIDAAASFGSSQGRIETQSSFIGQLTDSLKSGIGSLVDADLEETSARLQALQVQQQLGTQALSIANQAPQSILSLFR
jgi:flagellin